MADKMVARAVDAPRPSLVKRAMRRVVGELSVLRRSGWHTLSGTAAYRLDSSQVNYALARALYRNTEEKYKLGAGFAKPIVNTTAGFMGVPHFNHGDDEADQALEQAMERWTGKLLRLTRNALRDGDAYARLSLQPLPFGEKGERIDLSLVPPEWVSVVPDPITGGLLQAVIRYPMTSPEASGQRKEEFTVVETLTPTERKVEIEGKAPEDLRRALGVGQGTNPWGFIPLVHIRNEAEEQMLNGVSNLEPVEPFMRAYHDVAIFAIEGAKMFARPKPKFKLKDVQKFLRDNFTPEEIRERRLKFGDKEVFLITHDDEAEFMTADPGLAGVTTLLEFLFMCIVDVSETPEFAFGTAVASSKASVSEQMIPLARKVRRKRGMFEEPLVELAAMYLAMWARQENRRLDTYQVTIGWEEISPRNDSEVAQTIKTLVEGLTTAAESGLISQDAAAEFLREFVPTMLPWLDPDADDDEARRVARSVARMARLQDGRGFSPDEEGRPQRQRQEGEPPDQNPQQEGEQVPFRLPAGELDAGALSQARAEWSAWPRDYQVASGELLDGGPFRKEDPAHQGALALLREVARGERYTTLYRGVAVTDEQAAQLAEGHRMTIPLSSWTPDREVAEQFAERQREPEGRRVAVLLAVQDARGYRVGEVAGLGPEVVTAGHYRVAWRRDWGGMPLLIELEPAP